MGDKAEWKPREMIRDKVPLIVYSGAGFAWGAACIPWLGCGKLQMKKEMQMLNLFVVDAGSGEKISVVVREASEQNLTANRTWQTSWEMPFAVELPNKVVPHRVDDEELLDLMSYESDERSLAVEVIYMESARYSNANLLHTESGQWHMPQLG